MDKTMNHVKSYGSYLRSVFFCKKYLLRDATILGLIVAISAMILAADGYIKRRVAQPLPESDVGIVAGASDEKQTDPITSPDVRIQAPVETAEAAETKAVDKEQQQDASSIVKKEEVAKHVAKKPLPAKITAPMPASYKVVNGRKVCAKENDKPRKSKQKKGIHMDMECCMDPDEIPNPHCYYDPQKYGKYLK